MGHSAAESLPIARSRKSDICLLPAMANRHGLIAGATGTGKTITLRVLAEKLSGIGVPVFLADVKGDLSAIPYPGGDHPKVAERIQALGLKGFRHEGRPVVFWDLFGEQGHHVRATVSEMGPLLLGRILNLNDIQSGVLSIVFKIADDNGLLLLDLKDLRSMVRFAGENAERFRSEYGNISPASVGAIQRNLLSLEQQGGDRFFGEPAIDLKDFLQTDASGKGIVNILTADKLMQSPRLYATFLLFLLSELFENLPEVGDPQKPSLVFFFDEAHMLFEDAPKALTDKIEQVVRLIRSKGVGIFFVTQNPLDLPETVLGQLGNRVQHALRAFTPKEQRAVKTAAETFRRNPGLDAVKAITELSVGEALVSVLDGKGSPTVVERALVYPPISRLAPLTAEERAKILRDSVLAGHYERQVDRESAYETLKARAAEAPETEAHAGPQGRPTRTASGTGDLIAAAAKSAAHAIGSQIGRQIVRGVLGSILGGRR